jgi:predicted deacylase
MLPNYEETRNRYFKVIQALKRSYRYVQEETAYNGMHFCYISNSEQPQKLFAMTAGIHGIEGYVGSEMICYFLEKHLSEIDLNHHAVIIVNFINAWGMRNLTRNNSDGIDLNRNFVDDFLHLPCHKVAHPFFKGHWVTAHKRQNSHFFVKEVMPLFLSRYWLLMTDRLLRGQYIDAEYPFYGGTQMAPENIILLNWLKPYLEAEVDWILLDFHTGIGDYGAMTLILDRTDAKSLLQWKLDLGFSNVLRTGEGAMYDVDGDFTGWLHTHHKNRRHCSITVEFGMRRQHFLSSFFSMKHLVIENGARLNRVTLDRSGFVHDFYPQKATWWPKAKHSFSDGLKGLIDVFQIGEPATVKKKR